MEEAEAIERARRLLANAREGVSLLVRSASEGVTLDAFDADDWRLVLSLCGPEVAASHASGAPPFDGSVKEERAALDAFTRRVFDSFRCVECT